MEQYRPFEYYKVSAEYVLKKIGFTPEIGIILGSGLGTLDKEVLDPIVIPYKEIPNFPQSTAPGHKGVLVCGTLSGKKVALMSGRFHAYEGYETEVLLAPVRLFKLLGCQKVILTNASGGVNTDYKPGDIMVIKDHIKFNGSSPLRGQNVDEFGTRFPDTTNMYTASLRKIALELGKRSASLRFHEGTYFFMPGPQFETPAEIRAIRILGGDAVGMSTVAEAITCAHCNLPCLGLSVICNMAAGITGQALSGSEVNETAATITDRFVEYFKDLVASI